MQRLLISVRGPQEAVAAIKGGAHIADVEYPASALGTPYPLNIFTVRNRLNRAGYKRIPVSTNIGEVPGVRASSCQAALGVATAGADIIKCGMAELPYAAAVYLGNLMVRSIKKFYPRKEVVPAVFVDDDMRRYFDPFAEGIELVKEINADGILIDTFNKSIGKGLLDYCTTKDLRTLANRCHKAGKEAWIAGSITKEELPNLWATGVDVICVRGAACEKTGKGRFGEVRLKIVKDLVSTMRRS
jgi:hypothetical protein